MTMVINGSGTITGLTAGGLPDATIVQADLAANVAGNGPAFSVYASAGQSLASINTFYKVVLNTEEFDTGAYFDSTTNYRFQPLIAGYYFISAETFFNGSTNPGTIFTSLFKNGSEYKTAAIFGANSTNGGAPASALVFLNGSTDYVEMYVKYASAGAGVVTTGGANFTYMTGYLARSA